MDLEQLVTASEIARRFGRSRQSVQQLITGARRPGAFPEPADWVRGARLWSWPAVERWAAEALGAAGAPRPSDMDFVAALNGALQTRRHLARLDEPSRRRAVTAVLGVQAPPPSGGRQIWGDLAGSMSPDFDEPLEDFDTHA